MPLPLITPDLPKIMSVPFAQVWTSGLTGQHSLHATLFFDEGDPICDFTAGAIVAQPSYLTIQIGLNKHITLQPDCLQYTNHSCNPNVFFDTDTMNLIALKSIHPDDELCFFYPSTEWKMAATFDCNCGASNCLGNIKGAAYLSEKQLNHYRITPFIQRLFENK